jgi:hypothetical protein
MRSSVVRAFRDDWRVLGATVLGLGVLAAVVTVAFVLLTGPSSGGEESERAAAEGENRASRRPITPPLPEVSAGDFVVPDEGRRLETWWWERFRTPGRPWDRARGDRFWRDPKGPALEYLQRRNDEEVERTLQKVP